MRVTCSGVDVLALLALLAVFALWIWHVQTSNADLRQRLVQAWQSTMDSDGDPNAEPDDAPVDDDPFCATCGCLPDEPEERDDGDGLWRLVRPCACDCHAASEGMEWD